MLLSSPVYASQKAPSGSINDTSTRTDMVSPFLIKHPPQNQNIDSGSFWDSQTQRRKSRRLSSPEEASCSAPRQQSSRRKHVDASTSMMAKQSMLADISEAIASLSPEDLEEIMNDDVHDNASCSAPRQQSVRRAAASTSMMAIESMQTDISEAIASLSPEDLEEIISDNDTSQHSSSSALRRRERPSQRRRSSVTNGVGRMMDTMDISDNTAQSCTSDCGVHDDNQGKCAGHKRARRTISQLR
eukprot:scaffold346888_cov49-Attheya_sp.AAC.1